MTTASELAVDPWWHKPLRLLQTNLREEDATLDTSTAVLQVRSLGYDSWLCNAGGIAYFYPVAQPYQQAAATLSERPSGDLVGDALEAAHASGVRFLARFDFSRLPSRIIEANPDWAFMDYEDRWYVEDGLTAICPTSDYHERLVPEILRDFVERYDVDGIFFNWLQYPEFSYSMKYKGVCQCERCKLLFETEHPGEPHPRTMADDGYALWLAVARKRLSTLADTYAKVINAIRPGTPLLLADVRVDVAFLEINSWLTGHAGGGWWQHTPSELASMNRIADPRTPALVHSSVNVGLPYRQIAEQPSQFRRYIAQALSRGAQPSTVVVGPVDTARFPCLPAAVDLLEFHRAHAADIYANYRSAAEIAIIRPGGGPVLGSAQVGDVPEYRGLYTALQESQIPFDILGLQFQDNIVLNDTLSHYRVVLAPSTEGFGRPLLDALDEYVAGGGRLLLTSESFDPDSASRLKSAPATRRTRQLDEVPELGGRYIGSDSERAPLLPVIGRFSFADWRADADRRDLVLSTQSPFGPPEISGGNTPDPIAYALVRAKYGEGEVSQFPWSIGRSAHESGLKAVDEVIVREVHHLTDNELVVRGEFPTDVEITLGRAGDSWVVHIVNHSGGRFDRVREPVPLRGRLVLGRELSTVVAGASAERAGTVLPLERAVDGIVSIAIDVNSVLEVVRLD